jgi:hypothetical protein
MTNKAFVGGVYLARGDGGSPEVFTRICQTYGLGDFGQKNTLVDVTTFCSGGVMEYVSGLSDGSEITAEMNYESLDPVQLAMIDACKNKAIGDFELQVEGTTPGVVDVTFMFTCRYMAWTIKPSVSGKNTITFSLKISGDIVHSP